MKTILILPALLLIFSFDDHLNSLDDRYLKAYHYLRDNEKVKKFVIDSAKHDSLLYKPLNFEVSPQVIPFTFRGFHDKVPISLVKDNFEVFQSGSVYHIYTEEKEQTINEKLSGLGNDDSNIMCFFSDIRHNFLLASLFYYNKEEVKNFKGYKTIAWFNTEFSILFYFGDDNEIQEVFYNKIQIN